MTDVPIAHLDRLAIVQECTQLIAHFAERSDARDCDALGAMFVDDGVFCRPTKPGEPIRGRATIVEGFRSRPAHLMTRHVVTNTVVTVVSANEATAVSYILLYTAKVEDGAKLPVPADAKQLLGAFHDTIVRDADGAWMFKERRGSLAMTIG